MTKNTKRTNDTKTTVIVIVAAVVFVAVIVAAVLLLSKNRNENPPMQPTQQPTQQTGQTEQPTETTEIEVFPFEIPGFTLIADAPTGTVNEQLSIIGVGSYTGPFYEDGSDEPVTDVLAIVVQNVSEEWVENADLTLACGDDTAMFAVSALPNQTCAILLEQNRLTYTEGTTLKDPACTFCTNDMSGKKLDFESDFSFEPNEGDILVLRNVSGRKFAGDAVLYYKNVAPYGLQGELLYLGGITYSFTFKGPIGAMQQGRPPHYTMGGSAMMFMTYDS